MAVVVLLACALLALSMSQKMVLQHHYGHHMFGDDLAQGAKLSMRSHNRHRPLPHTGLRGTVQDVVEEVEAGVATVEERLADELHGFQRAPPGVPCGVSPKVLFVTNPAGKKAHWHAAHCHA